MKKLGVAALLWGMGLGSLRADQPMNEMMLAGGMATSIQDDAVHLRDSASVAVSYYRRVCPWAAVGLETGLFAGGRYGGIAPQGTDSDGNGNLDQISFDESALGLVYRLTPEIRIGPLLGSSPVQWHPFVAGGGGLYSATYASTAGLSARVPAQANHGGFNYGAGLLVYFARGFGLGAEIRWHHMIDRGAPDTVYQVPSLLVALPF